MPRLREQPWFRILLGYAFFAVLLGIAARYVSLAVASADRILVIRIAAALFAGVILRHACHAHRRREESRVPSFTETANQPQPLADTIDPAFLKLRDQLRIAIGSAGYFEHIFWPRLMELAAPRRGGKRESTPATMPPMRKLMKRGPRLRDLERVVDEIERRR